MTIYYQDDAVTLHHGDFREILPSLGMTFDLIVADPPYEVILGPGGGSKHSEIMQILVDMLREEGR